MDNNNSAPAPVSGTDFKFLFRPRSVAHVGASAKEILGRFNFTKFLLEMKFQGSIFPINPKYTEINGLKSFPDLTSVPGVIDIVILAIPAANCAEVLRDVPAGKINFVVIHTSGFGEIGMGGLEVELLDLARKKGFRIIGPNCMGVYSQQGRIGFWRDHHEAVKLSGSVGLISQSGGNAINTIRGGLNVGLHLDRAVSLGNQIDVSIIELLDYYGRDDDISVIGIYVESVRDGRRFLELLKRITRIKPVVVWNGGTTGEGKSAAATHTGSIAGNAEIFQSAMRQAGAILADERSEFLQLLRLLQPQYKLPGENLAILSPGGGNTVSICDMIASRPNLRIPRFSELTLEKLKQILPVENVDVKNPVDSGAAGIFVVGQLLPVVQSDKNIESVIIMMDVDFLVLYDSDEKRAEVVDRVLGSVAGCCEKSGKPAHILLIQHRQGNEAFDSYRRMVIGLLNKYNIPWIAEPFSNAAAVYSKLAWYNKYLKLCGV